MHLSIRPSQNHRKSARLAGRAFAVLLMGAAPGAARLCAQSAATIAAPPPAVAADAASPAALPSAAPAILAPAAVPFAFPSAALAFPAPAAQQRRPASSPSTGEFPRPGGHELQAWTGYGGAVVIAHTIPHENVWNLGFRYGWVLTGPSGPGWLRGTFEYAVDLVPMYLIYQPGGPAYGWGFDGFVLKWNLVPRRRIVPYAELTGGALFTNRSVPTGINNVNFTPQIAFGAHFLRGKYAWSADVRFLHISDAGLTHYNPGIDDIQVRIGFGAFTRPKE